MENMPEGTMHPQHMKLKQEIISKAHALFVRAKMKTEKKMAERKRQEDDEKLHTSTTKVFSPETHSVNRIVIRV